MPGIDYLLDTNVAIALMAGDPAVTARRASGAAVLLCIPVLAELYFGAYKSARVGANLASVEGLRSAVAMLELDDETAREFGRIKAELRRKGRPIPENDVWIAASARRHGVALATRDAHFGVVDRLTVEIW